MTATKTIAKTTWALTNITAGGASGVWGAIGTALTAKPGSTLHKIQHATGKQNRSMSHDYMYEKTSLAIDYGSDAGSSMYDSVRDFVTDSEPTVKKPTGYGSFGK